MVSKIIYTQQFDAAVQRKKNKYTTNSKSQRNSPSTVIATVNGKKYKNRCVSDTTAVVVHMAKFIYTPLAQAYSEATSKEATVK